MTVKVTKPAINVREELADLRKPSGVAGEAMLRAETPQEQFNLIGAGRRNLLINSEFKVNQRNSTSITGSGGADSFLGDRWRTYAHAVDYSASIQEVTLPDGTVANSHKTVATSTASSGFFHPYQRVEAFGKDYLQGKEVVLSAWVRTNVAGQFIRICDTVSCYTLGSEIPSDGEWHKVSASHTMSTSMLTGVTNYMQFHPIFASVALATNDYCEFALPQMELGKVATPFEHRSYGEELALCQRYFQVFKEGRLGGVINGTGHGIVFNQYIQPSMRSSPTTTVVGVPDIAYMSGSSQIQSTVTGVTASGYKMNIVKANGSTGDGLSFWVDCTSSNNFTFDAEL